MGEETHLLDRARQMARLRSLSRKTENAYLNHIRRFLAFNGNRDLSKVKAKEVCAFLAHLENDEHLAAATQNQALCALTFLYRDVFGRKDVPCFGQISRARLPNKLPAVFTSEEVKAVLSYLKDAPFLAAALIYGAGLRLNEALRLRVGDIDFKRFEINVREVQSGAKVRTTVLPKSIVAPLKRHLAEVKFLHEDDCLRGYGAVRLPPAILRKHFGVEREWHWQFVFPACRLAADNGTTRRHHLAESTIQKAINDATGKAQIAKNARCQNLRYSFAVRLFEQNTDIHTIQNLLGHKNMKTTMSYFNVFGSVGRNIQSPLDY
jgi:integron integrase